MRNGMRNGMRNKGRLVVDKENVRSRKIERVDNIFFLFLCKHYNYNNYDKLKYLFR